MVFESKSRDGYFLLNYYHLNYLFSLHIFLYQNLIYKFHWGVNTLLEQNKDAKVLGLSATPIRYLDKNRDMSDEIFEGNIVFQMDLTEAVARGILHFPFYILSSSHFKTKKLFPVPGGSTTATLFFSFNPSTIFSYASLLCGFNSIAI